MATDMQYTFHIRAEKHIAESFFARILEAGLQYDNWEAQIQYSQDERGYSLFFCGNDAEEPSAKIGKCLVEFSANGAEIDWMMLTNDGGLYTCCCSYINGESVIRFDAQTWIDDWDAAVLVGKAYAGDSEALSKIPNLIRSHQWTCGGTESKSGTLSMFGALAEHRLLQAKSEDVEYWSELLSWMTNDPDDEYIEGCEAILSQIALAVETRKLLDRVVEVSPKRHVATV